MVTDPSPGTAWRAHALAAKGFMPPDEGDALYDAAVAAAVAIPGLPLLEVGSYCGRSTVWLGAAARDRGTVLFAVDHHRGSEENQAGWEHHDPTVVDPRTGRMDTLPVFRRTIFDADLEDWVVAVVGQSPAVARAWQAPLAFVFIDGGHGVEPAQADYEGWTPHVVVGGMLAIHDVFPDPADGGRPPYEQIYLPAIESGRFEEISGTGSLRVLRRVA
jgi:MMP 1-O-methyltransferase